MYVCMFQRLTQKSPWTTNFMAFKPEQPDFSCYPNSKKWTHGHWLGGRWTSEVSGNYQETNKTRSCEKRSNGWKDAFQSSFHAVTGMYENPKVNHILGCVATSKMFRLYFYNLRKVVYCCFIGIQSRKKGR